jgi:hypothetical protein
MSRCGSGLWPVATTSANWTENSGSIKWHKFFTKEMLASESGLCSIHLITKYIKIFCALSLVKSCRTLKINPNWGLRLWYTLCVDVLYTSVAVIYKYEASVNGTRKWNNYYTDFPHKFQSKCPGIELGSPVSGMRYNRTVCGHEAEP